MRAAYPDAPTPWIDLSTGINPWPYPNLSVSPSAQTDLPTRAALEACQGAMAAAIGADPDALVLAPGSEILIRLLPTLIAPRRVAILQPTYGDHAETWTRAGAEVIRSRDPLSCADSADAVVITNPNNPDGRLFNVDAIREARRTLAARGGWLIVDEAYSDLVQRHSVVRHGGEDGLIVLRSFGKFFGLAGMRLGGLLAPVAFRNTLSHRLGAWPVSGAALEIGARAFADTTWQQNTREDLKIAARRLDDILISSKLNIVGGTNLFRLIETPDAHKLFERLAEAGIYVRRFRWPETHLRVGLPPHPDAEARLRAALNPSI